MRRIAMAPRAGWQEKVEAVGLVYHTPQVAGMDRPYWDESACYEFTAAEVDTLEAAGNTMQEMCLAAAQRVIDRRKYADLEIPASAVPLIEWAWEQEPPAIYGRFDFMWAGEGSGQAPKLLEYNADTPTSLLEAAVVQWHWLKDMGERLPGHGFLPFTQGQPDQFNSLHEKLIAKWKDVADHLRKPVYFASVDDAEDMLTVTYLRDTAEQAGLSTRAIAMDRIGWNEQRQAFVDEDGAENRIESIFKLYPWESMLREQFGAACLKTYKWMHWMEPIWKMLLSNKGILPVLWEMYPGHELLLEARFDTAGAMREYVRKPVHSREGANVAVTRADGSTVETGGPYGGGRQVFQALAPAAVFDGRHPVLGLWMVDQECCGMGIRESAGAVTDNLSSFVPHYFRSPLGVGPGA